MAVELKVTLNESVYDRVVRLARRRRQDIGETVAQFLEEELPAEGEEETVINWSEADESVDQEIAAYRRLHPDLWRKYPGQHVAIQNGRLVDQDADGLGPESSHLQPVPEHLCADSRGRSTARTGAPASFALIHSGYGAMIVTFEYDTQYHGPSI